ncbi:MAG TPA: ABC transporter ATP-binding protein [Thermodesulfobacteriota bacterium]|nr:ABC transporter ATP-binding protein [Thermodesulfobacteriota bacterium]
MSLLKVEEIHTYYGRSYILQGASLEIGEKEIVALLGRNGAGKTTTLKTIMGLVKPRAGRILLHGEDITSLPAFLVARKGIGYAPQGRHLFPRMTVLENLKTGMTNPSSPGSLKEAFDLFPVLSERQHQLAGTLSGGEQQALAIARAMVLKPAILLLDEPTTGLMPLFVAKLKNIIQQMNDQGMTILLVEEKIPFAMSLAHRIYFMVKGKAEFSAEPHKIQGNKEILIRYLGVEV